MPYKDKKRFDEYHKQWRKINKQRVKEYDRRNGKVNRAKIRQIIIDAKSKPCKDCGMWYPHFVMDFDHVKGKKKITIASAVKVHLSPDKLKEEIDKCEVVCSNCHRLRTFMRKQKIVTEVAAPKGEELQDSIAQHTVEVAGAVRLQTVQQ